MKTNNVLLLGPPHSGKIRVAQHLTNDFDTSTIEPKSHSGLIYNFDLQTRYFSSNVNLLIEEYPDSRESNESLCSSLQAFAKELASDEFTELREALDGLIFTLDYSVDPQTVTSLFDLFCEIKDMLEDNDVFSVVVGFAGPTQKSEPTVVEDEAISNGFEFVDFAKTGKNEYMEKLGKDRLVEILQTHDWSQTEKPISDETYADHKKSKFASMSQKLLPGEDEDENDKRFFKDLSQSDLTTLLAKLQNDKLQAQGMTDEEKKSFVDDLVDNYMEYF